MLPDFQWSHLHRSKEQIQTRNIDTRITLQISSNIKTYHVYISSYQVIECDSVKLRRHRKIIESQSCWGDSLAWSDGVGRSDDCFGGDPGSVGALRQQAGRARSPLVCGSGGASGRA